MSDSDRPKPPARPTTPKLSARPSSARPGRPGRVAVRAEASVEPPPPPEPVIAETIVVALPPPPAPAPRRPSIFGSVRARQTLFPPCATLAVGMIGLGTGYFLQAPDAALRQVRPAVAVVILSLGVLAAACAVGLARSLHRIDSLPPDS